MKAVTILLLVVFSSYYADLLQADMPFRSLEKLVAAQLGDSSKRAPEEGAEAGGGSTEGDSKSLGGVSGENNSNSPVSGAEGSDRKGVADAGRNTGVRPEGDAGGSTGWDVGRGAGGGAGSFSGGSAGWGPGRGAGGGAGSFSGGSAGWGNGGGAGGGAGSFSGGSIGGSAGWGPGRGAGGGVGGISGESNAWGNGGGFKKAQFFDGDFGDWHKQKLYPVPGVNIPEDGGNGGYGRGYGGGYGGGDDWKQPQGDPVPLWENDDVGDGLVFDLDV